jgi:hypothetical protein
MITPRDLWNSLEEGGGVMEFQITDEFKQALLDNGDDERLRPTKVQFELLTSKQVRVRMLTIDDLVVAELPSIAFDIGYSVTLEFEGPLPWGCALDGVPLWK